MNDKETKRELVVIPFGDQGRIVAGALVALLVITTIFFIGKTINEFEKPVPRAEATINVAGEGEVFAIPDTARFTFSVQEEAETVPQAQEVVTETTNTILDALRQLGIPEENIKTVSYNVFPRYEFRDTQTQGFTPPQGERVLVGYEVSQTVEVKVEDPDEAGTLLAEVGELGADTVSGLRFTIDDMEALEEEALEIAIADAREKAESLADSLGVRLGSVVSFSEQGGSFPQAHMLGRGGEMAMDTAEATPDIPRGENQITKRVNVTFGIR